MENGVGLALYCRFAVPVFGKQAQLRKYPENVSGGAAPFAL